MTGNEKSKQPDVVDTSFAQRNLALAARFFRILATNHELRDSLPKEPRLVFLPVDDPELTRFNLQLAQGKSDVVYICMKGSDSDPEHVEVSPWTPGQTAVRSSYA